MISTKCDKCKIRLGVGCVMNAKVNLYHVFYVMKL